MFRKVKHLLLLTLLIVFTSIIITNAQDVPIANSFRFPLEGDWSPLWQDFGKWNNQWNGYHLGEDIGREDADIKNYAVYPMADGIVKFADIVMGYTVIIEHKLSNDDPDGDYVCSAYYHMKRSGEGGIKLTLGEVVFTDSPIGYVSGKRKDYKSLPHLHFGIRKGSYKSGKDPRTGFWHYPGYTTIKINNEVQKNPDDPTHKQILTDWFNPAADKPGFIESHIIQIVQSTIDSSSKNIERDSTSIDQQGGCLILLECTNTPTNDKVNKITKIIKNHLDGLDISESVIRRYGTKRILIELPRMNIEERKKIIDYIIKAVQVEILAVETLGPVIEGDSITQVPIKEEEIKTEKEKLLIDSSLYHFEHSMPVPPGYLPVSVRGPADELALILANPEGETDIRFISKRALIDNFETVELGMGNAPFSEGPYILTVKTVTPEKVVYKTELWFTSPDVSIADAEFTYEITYRGGAYGYAGYYFLEIVSLTLINNGDLPAKRDTDARALITLDGKPENMTLLTRRYSISPYKKSLYPPIYIPNGKNRVPVHAGDAMYGLKKGNYFVTITIPLMGGETVSFKKALTIE